MVRFFFFFRLPVNPAYFKAINLAQRFLISEARKKSNDPKMGVFVSTGGPAILGVNGILDGQTVASEYGIF